MLDKTHGKVIAFQNGRPAFFGAALTGETRRIISPPDAFTKEFLRAKGFEIQSNPAGRYTVSVGYDNAYGEILDVNEIQGSDWDIAIHKVWLGAPAEHRDARLRSASDQDKHITYGCIDVDGPTMQGLLDRRPTENKTPPYILPQDERSVAKFFLREAVGRKWRVRAGEIPAGGRPRAAGPTNTCVTLVDKEMGRSMPMPVSRVCSRLLHGAKCRHDHQRKSHSMRLTMPVSWTMAGIMLLVCHLAYAASWDTVDRATPQLNVGAHRPRYPPSPAQPMRPENAGFAVGPAMERRPGIVARGVAGQLDRQPKRRSRFPDGRQNRGKLILFRNGRPVQPPGVDR